MSTKPRDRLKLDRLFTGDCANVLSKFPADCIALTVTSPPFDDLRDYDGHIYNFAPVARELYRVTAPGGVLVWVTADHCGEGRSGVIHRAGETGTSLRQALHLMDLGFTLHDTMFAEWPNKMSRQKYRYEQVVDYMFVFCKGVRPNTCNIRRVPCANAGKVIQLRKGKPGDQAGVYRDRSGPRRSVVVNADKPDSNIWRYPTGFYQTSGDALVRDHPAPFPEGLARDHIESWSRPGDVVLDPFCGSGTTLKMAKLASRFWIGIDVCPEYVEMSRKRLAFYHRRDELPAMPGRRGMPVYLESVTTPRVVRAVMAPTRMLPEVDFVWAGDEPTLTVDQAARRASRTVAAIRALVRRRRLAAKRIDKLWRIPVRAVDALKPPQKVGKRQVRQGTISVG